MSIFCLGVNHKTAPIAVREKLAFPEKTISASLAAILELDGIEEAVILSTCNRVEIYGSSSHPEISLDALSAFLVGHFGVAGQPVEFYRHEDEAAAHHLFAVASGLDSMVLGETEIFGQVKKAYAVAQEARSTGRAMNKLFQQSFTIGKMVRSNSKIQHGATSIGSVAVDLAEQIFGKLDGCGVMIMGAGEMSRTTAQSMLSRGASSIIVSNRSYERAEELAGSLGGRALRFDDWESCLDEVDILISSTSAPHPVIHEAAIDRQMRKRRGRSLFLIDIAVPRDIEEGVNFIDNAFLFNIDQLQRIAEEGRVRREEQIILCRSLIAEFLDRKGIDALRTPPSTGHRIAPVDSKRPLTHS